MDLHKKLLSDIQSKKRDLRDEESLDALIDAVGNAKIVMLGEASHGTHEYYMWRSLISKRLITEKGFKFIAVEGDWPACYQVNRYIKNYRQAGQDAIHVLENFNRWPSWMWNNWEIAALTEWLRRQNTHRDIFDRIGFYGLDVYSLWESLDSIINYLLKEDPEAAELARESIRCFEPYRDEEDGQKYAWATQLVPTSCEEEVLKLLNEISSRSPRYDTDMEAPFSTEQNALVAVNAEKYYRAMIKPGPDSWNIRDHHMMETLNRLLDFHGESSKAIIWEHNTHIGDARFTDMRDDGMINIGQLAREQYGESEVKLVGFGSYKGSVMAGKAWGAKQQKMVVPEARENSWEATLHKVSPTNFYLLSDELTESLTPRTTFDHRAIGVVYHPERERFGNYVPSQISKRYDAFMYLDETKALHPISDEGVATKVPDTYPWNV